MLSYIADTNLLLRHTLNDIPLQASFAEEYFKKAQKGLIRITICPVVLFEMFFVLEKFYRFDRPQVAYYLLEVVTTPYLEVEEREIFTSTVPFYKEQRIDFVDAYLFAKAQAQAAEVLSFDKDFRKLKNRPRPRTPEEG